MKTRRGFVSNSSSTSFCIYGAFIESKHFEDVGKPKDTVDYDWVESLGTDQLEVHGTFDGYSYGFYFGKSWDRIGDDETGAQFKKSIREAIEKVLGKPFDCSTCEESWYDG